MSEHAKQPAGLPCFGLELDHPDSIVEALVMSRAEELLRNAVLYCLISGPRALDLTRAAVAGGAQVVQLRDKQLSDRALVGLAVRMAGICHEAGALLIVNDRPDIARVAGADGVHLGQEDLPVAAARKILPDRLVGVSTHSDAEIEAALADGADYLGIGCCFPSATKEVAQQSGLELVSRWSGRLDRPYFPLGGITLERVGQVLARGARSVAVGSAVCDAEDPQRVARTFRQRLIAGASV